MNTCKTCNYWVQHEDRYHSICFPRKPGSAWEQCDDEAEVVAIFGHRVRVCEHPKVLFYQRPERDGAAVCDGSEYAAELLTAEDFGCVLHSAKTGRGQ